MGRLPTLQPKVATLNTRRVAMATPATGERKPWANSCTAGNRLRGRALQARNARIKARDHYTCKGCGRVTTELEVDHIIPMAQGGMDEDDNLQLMCSGLDGCHAAKSKREAKGG